MRYGILSLLFIPLTTHAQIERLTAIPFVGEGAGIGELVFGLYLVAITVAAVFAVVKLAIAGIKYATSDVVSSKESAKSDIKGAILGLLILLGVVILVNTINENIADTDISLPADPLPSPTDPRDSCPDAYNPECPEFPPNDTVVVACTGQGTPTSGPCDEEMEGCRDGELLDIGEIGEATVREGTVYCIPTGEYDLEIAEEWCDEQGGIFDVEGDGTPVCGTLDEDDIETESVNPNNPDDMERFFTRLEEGYDLIRAGHSDELDLNDLDALDDAVATCRERGGTTAVLAEYVDSDGTETGQGALYCAE